MRKFVGRIVGAAAVAGAVLSGTAVLRETNTFPRTDDAEVVANYIGVAPEVSGPILKIHVADNQLVRKGELLFEIDPAPFQYALDGAMSRQSMLEGQIEDLRRKIAAQGSAVHSARASVNSAEATVSGAQSAMDAARAAVANARSGMSRAEAEYTYAGHNLQRIEPLLAKQFVTVDQVDQARTALATRLEAVRQSKSEVAKAEAELAAASARQNQAKAAVRQTEAQLEQSIHEVTTLEPLVAQRSERAAIVKQARYDLERTKVYAPFDARVTNLIVSQGAYAKAGQQVFTLIDTRTWWVMGNFRETQLARVQPGMKADVYVMSRPDHRYEAVVDSVGFGVTPDTSLVGNFSSEGLPNVQRSLNWVHLATRFPVRVKVTSPTPEDFRIGASAMVTVRGQ